MKENLNTSTKQFNPDWRRILLPNSNDYEACSQAFEKAYAHKLPTFPERCLVVEQDDRLYARVRSANIPMLIAAGYGDVGLVFNDVFEEYNDELELQYEYLDGITLTFGLLVPQSNEAVLLERLYTFDKPPLIVATAYPNFLHKTLAKLAEAGQQLNIQLSPLPVYGAAEAMCKLGVADVVADVVKTGSSARANNLTVIQLNEIRPVMVFK